MAFLHLLHPAMLEIKCADQSGVALLLQWAKAEGWNPGIDDATPFYDADPQGFLLGYIEGTPVSGISVVASGQTFGFLGLYIVHPDHRGQGFGLATWNAGIAKLVGRTIGLDGVVAQQANYARSGFVFSHRSFRFRGCVKPANWHEDIAKPIETSDIASIIAFDTAHYGSQRSEFLRSWLDASGRRRGFCTARDGQIIGYGVIRQCHFGFKIGPLFASRAVVAEALFTRMLKVAGSAEVFIDVPEPNGEGLRMMERFGFSLVFETARMYRGPAPPLQLHCIYGLTSFELG
jgi:GNAT superfamily N-acetyltransferase